MITILELKNAFILIDLNIPLCTGAANIIRVIPGKFALGQIKCLAGSIQKYLTCHLLLNSNP